jgi:hypothetical protein
LQELSFDVVNCVATLKQINHLADVNATDNLRKIIKRLPDHLIDKWKGVASDLRDKGETPSLEQSVNSLENVSKPNLTTILVTSRNPREKGHPRRTKRI